MTFFTAHVFIIFRITLTTPATGMLTKINRSSLTRGATVTGSGLKFSGIKPVTNIIKRTQLKHVININTQKPEHTIKDLTIRAHMVRNIQ